MVFHAGSYYIMEFPYTYTYTLHFSEISLIDPFSNSIVDTCKISLRDSYLNVSENILMKMLFYFIETTRLTPFLTLHELFENQCVHMEQYSLY